MWDKPQTIGADTIGYYEVAPKWWKYCRGKGPIMREIKKFLKGKTKVRVTVLPGTRVILEDISKL